jgi:hypothetical protein
VKTHAWIKLVGFLSPIASDIKKKKLRGFGPLANYADEDRRRLLAK